jgi:urease
MKNMFAATDSVPLNFGFTGKGNDSGAALGALRDIVEAGAAGLKLHEDWGSTPECIDRALQIGDEYDVQVCVMTRSKNEPESAPVSDYHRQSRSISIPTR